MRDYKTLDQLDSLTSALRALDLVGQLPLREPALPVDDPLIFDALAIADDWQAVGEDLWESYRTVLADRALLEQLEKLTDHENREALEALRTIGVSFEEVQRAAEEALSALSETYESPEHRYGEDAEEQMELFHPDHAKKAG